MSTREELHAKIRSVPDWIEASIDYKETLAAEGLIVLAQIPDDLIAGCRVGFATDGELCFFWDTRIDKRTDQGLFADVGVYGSGKFSAFLHIDDKKHFFDDKPLKEFVDLIPLLRG